MNKIALIIGNATYPDSPLRNPVNDADDVQERLTRLGFKTIKYTDASNKEMEEGLNEFFKHLSSCEVALFFFAGHGMQISGKNYLTAIDTNFEKEIDAKYSSLQLDKVIEVMEGGTNQTDIIMLDACRNNPYERRWRGVDSRGLAPVYAPKGMIIGYATSPGQVAFDGNGENGAYTDAFLRHLSTPDITIEDLFKRVRNTLSSSTRGRQISWEHTSLMGDFYFNYSLATDDLLPEYSEKSLADAGFTPHSSDIAREIINGLKSYNWYVQNPAILKIDQDALEQFKKDEIFVLGRNVYQAACGKAQKAVEYIDNLQRNLDQLNESERFHMLNGVLFEIYFDSTGSFRTRTKSGMIDSVFQIEESEQFIESFKFIQYALKPFFKNLFYIPSSARGISLDVSFVVFEDANKAIDGVFFEGDNVLYDETGNEYFDPEKDDSIRKTTKEELKERLSEALTTPSFRLKANFINLENGIETVLVPYRLNIKRLAK
ncbi:MAG: caspase family protein [Candidatus Electrothrix sp. Rat3]|nr:caspase family protein [Candidatus Electrothrix rattekaaiensis]